MKKLKSILLTASIMVGMFLSSTSLTVGEACPSGTTGLCIKVNGAPNSCGNSVQGKADCKKPADEGLG
jgi:hypothetical protein